MNTLRKLATLFTGVILGASLTAWFYEDRIAQIMSMIENVSVHARTDEQRQLSRDIERDLTLLAMARDASNTQSLAAIDDALYRLQSNRQTLDIIFRNSDLVIDGEREWLVEDSGAKFDRRELESLDSQIQQEMQRW